MLQILQSTGGSGAGKIGEKSQRQNSPATVTLKVREHRESLPKITVLYINKF